MVTALFLNFILLLILALHKQLNDLQQIDTFVAKYENNLATQSRDVRFVLNHAKLFSTKFKLECQYLLGGDVIHLPIE